MIGGIQFDWTISIGNILTAIGFVSGCVIFAMRVRTDVAAVGIKLVNLEEKLGIQVTDIKGDVKEMRGSMKELATVLITIARQDERMGFMERRIAELSSRQYDTKNLHAKE